MGSVLSSLNHAFSLDSSTTVLFYMKSASLYMSVKYLKYPMQRGPPGRRRVWQRKDYGRWNKTTWVHDENICKTIPPRRTDHARKIAWWHSGERNKLSSLSLSARRTIQHSSRRIFRYNRKPRSETLLFYGMVLTKSSLLENLVCTNPLVYFFFVFVFSTRTGASWR
jgi:hypothetical protein